MRPIGIRPALLPVPHSRLLTPSERLAVQTRKAQIDSYLKIGVPVSSLVNALKKESARCDLMLRSGKVDRLGFADGLSREAHAAVKRNLAGFRDIISGKTPGLPDPNGRYVASVRILEALLAPAR